MTDIMSLNEQTPNILSHEDGKNIQELAETAAKIALHNFEWRYITFVFFNCTLMYGAEVFLKSYNEIVIVGKGTFYPKFTKITSQFVLFTDDVPNMVNTLSWIEAHEFFNTGKFIVVCQSIHSRLCDESEAMKIFWNYKITNVIFLKRENNVEGYTYFPLNDDRCKTDIAEKLNLAKPHDLFVRKLKNLNKCNIIVSTFIQTPFMNISDGKPTGADGDLLRVIGEGLNASLKLMTPRFGNGWGKLEENGTWSGSLADVYYDLANFSMTSSALTLARFSYFQISLPYYTSSVAWVAHPAILKPSSLKLLYPFQSSTLYAVAVSFLCVILCALISRSAWWATLGKKINLTRSRHSVVFYSWMIFMGLPSTKLPTKTALLHIAFFWMWYCILIRTFYQVCLISALQGSYYYKQFQSIYEAIEAEYPYGGGAALKDYYIDEPFVHDNWVNVETSDIVPTLVNISKGMKFVLAMNMETAKIVKKVGRLRIHFLPKKVVVSPTVIFFKKFSPLSQSVSFLLSKLTESGFSEKFYKNYAISPRDDSDQGGNEPIAMKHFTGCYAVLICGWIVSTGCFVIELYLRKIFKKSQRIKLCP